MLRLYNCRCVVCEQLPGFRNTGSLSALQRNELHGYVNKLLVDEEGWQVSAGRVAEVCVQQVFGLLIILSSFCCTYG